MANVKAETIGPGFFPETRRIEPIHASITVWDSARNHAVKTVHPFIFLLVLLCFTVEPTHATSPQELPILHQAVLQAHLQQVRALLKDTKAHNPNQRDQLGSTPLHLAVRADNVELIKLLLDHGANGNLTDGRGQNAMDLAKSWSVWWMLLRHGTHPGIDTTLFLIALSLLMVVSLSVWLRKVKAEAATMNQPDAYLTHESYQEDEQKQRKDAA